MGDMSIEFAIKVLSTAKVERTAFQNYGLAHYDRARRLAIEALREKQETQVANSIGGHVQANSGATAFRKGDVVAQDKVFLLECKNVHDSKAVNEH